MDIKTYYDTYLMKPGENQCAWCGKPTRFVSFGRGYNKYCNHACVVRDTHDKKNTKRIADYKEEIAKYNERIKYREELCNERVKTLKDDVAEYEWEGEKCSWLGGDRTLANSNKDDLLTDNSVTFIDGQKAIPTTDYIDESECQSLDSVFWL